MADTSDAPTHAYVARVWYRDPATLFNLVSFLVLLFGDQSFMEGIPDVWRHNIDKGIIAFNVWIRFQSSTRPVALTSGQVREVNSLPTDPQTVSDATRSKL